MAITISKALASGFSATYARPLGSSSVRLDTGTVELTIALYKDATARFSGASPADFDRNIVTLSNDERCAMLDIIYAAMARERIYPEGTPRDSDPEKEAL